MDAVEIDIQREPGALDLPLPAYATAGSAGMDLYAAIEGDLMLEPGARALVSTGIRLGLPSGYEGQVRPRSGLAWRAGVTLLNAPGTIDTDYQGVVQVILINLGQVSVTVRRGDRIAQLVVAPAVRVTWREGALDAERGGPGARGENGFGSTGYSR